jgi:hypothetical protein
VVGVLLVSRRLLTDQDTFRKESSLHILGNRTLLLGHFPFFNHSVSILCSNKAQSQYVYHWYVVGIFVAVTVVRAVWVIIYRLFFHPLAKVPGPLLARAFYFYSYWYNARGGRLYLQIEKFHQKYGK